MVLERKGLKGEEISTLDKVTSSPILPFEQSESRILILGGFLCFLIFLFDIQTKIGFVVSTLYLIPVLVCVWSPRRRTMFLIAGLASILTIVAIPLKPPDDILIPLFNRPLSLLVIWSFVFLIDLFITRLRNLEEGLRENIEIARQNVEEVEKLMDITPVAIWVAHDPECKVITGNQTADHFYESEDSVNVSAGSAFGGEWDKTRRFFRDGRELSPEELPMQEAVRTGMEVHGSELEVLLPSGERISILGNAKPLLDANGKARGSIASFINITERKRAENELLASKRTLADIIDFLPDATLVVDLEGKVVAWNQAIEKMTGVGKEDMIGKGDHVFAIPFYGVKRGMLMDLLTLDDEQIKNKYDYVARKRETLYAETFCSAINGGKGGYVWATATSIYDDRGNRVGSIESIRDITERKKAMDELRRSNSELQQFAYVASHDLQEPLRMVINYLSLLELRFKDRLDPKSEEYINFALEGGARMRELIDDLLDYSRIDTMGEKFVPVDMNDVVARTLALLNVQIEDSGAEIVVEALPTILADESQMMQLVQNLIGNAVKFRGLEQPKILVSASRELREWTFMVRDNGIGLNMDYADKIFQMFQRLHGKVKYPGTGVGLAIAKKIVERHGGRIWVESEEGKGATFFFTVPTSKSD